jgi:hypothetical protein
VLKAPFAYQYQQLRQGHQLNTESQLRQPMMPGSSWEEQVLEEDCYQILDSPMQVGQPNSGVSVAQRQTYSSKLKQEPADRRLLAKQQQLFNQNYGKI